MFRKRINQISGKGGGGLKGGMFTFVGGMRRTPGLNCCVECSVISCGGMFCGGMFCGDGSKAERVVLRWVLQG